MAGWKSMHEFHKHNKSRLLIKKRIYIYKHGQTKKEIKVESKY